jgi:hypothetical protein
LTSILIQSLLVALLLASDGDPSDITRILESKYENKMISSGKNRPAIRLSKDHFSDILVLLHHKIPPRDIQNHFAWTDLEFEQRMDTLLTNDFVKRTPQGRYSPTSMVISLEDAKTLQQTAAMAAGPAATVITNRLSEIKSFYAKLEPFRDIPFDDASLLILSDVILDNWQINSVESQFLQKERTPRHGVNYYHSLQQKGAGEDKESFGIYGNQMWSHERRMIGVYGNKRNTSQHLLSLSKEEMVQLFGMAVGDPQSASRGHILGALIRQATEPGYELEPRLQYGFDRLGLMKGDRLNIPIMNRGDYRDLGVLAALMTEDLAALLEEHRSLLEEAYSQSVYVDEVTFEEYFIWWYHFFYSAVTDVLVKNGQIHIPSAGVTTYIVDWSK